VSILSFGSENTKRPKRWRLRRWNWPREHFPLAEADPRKALALAHEFGAKGLEMRTALSLAKLFSNQDRREEARSMLAEIHNWFSEGFETADLEDAKAMLKRKCGTG
jgi:hypothetical protein